MIPANTVRVAKYYLRNAQSGLYVRDMRLASGSITKLIYTEPVGSDGVIDKNQGMGIHAASCYHTYSIVSQHCDALISRGEKIEIVER